MLKTKWLLLFVSILFVIPTLYYTYKEQKIPLTIAKSDYTMMQTDMMRFSFKVSLLMQKSYTALTVALKNRDEDTLYDALDYLDAAQGFLHIAFLEKKLPIDKIDPLIDKTRATIEMSGLSISKDELLFLYTNVQKVSLLMEKAETEIWIDFQNEFIDFQQHEYKLNTLYEIIIGISFFTLLLFIWFIIRQKRLNKNILQHEEELSQLAYYDVLTKVPNRKNIYKIIDERIEIANRNSSEFYVALIDLDDFKKVNDIHGHDAGDKVLIETVRRINEQIRVGDILGRFGGDEFVLIFSEAVKVNEIAHILERINDAFISSISFDSIEYFSNVSIGVVNYPHQASSNSELIKYADIAMYNSKAIGKGRYSFFRDSFSEKIEYQYRMEPEIKRALDKGEFELYYQPQVELKTKSVLSAEALVRWNHPQKGFIYPSKFIDIIEDGFLTQEFGEWVIKEASAQQKIWLQKGLDLSISVNLSVKHIMTSSFFKDIKVLVQKLDINLEKFYFEITEYELMHYHEHSIKVLNRLADAGFQFHLDDFGTGYSSITYLSNIQVQAIKIDKKFIDDIVTPTKSTPLVDAIISMADALDIEVIAEGVESKVQYDYLQAHHCSVLQGYYFSKPLCVEDFEAYLDSFSL